MTAAYIYRSHVFCNAYCTRILKKTIDKSASFDIIDTVPNELNIWGYSSAGRALEWHSRGQRFDPAYLHQAKSLETQQFRGFFYMMLKNWVQLLLSTKSIDGFD